MKLRIVKAGPVVTALLATVAVPVISLVGVVLSGWLFPVKSNPDCNGMGECLGPLAGSLFSGLAVGLLLALVLVGPLLGLRWFWAPITVFLVAAGSLLLLAGPMSGDVFGTIVLALLALMPGVAALLSHPDVWRKAAQRPDTAPGAGDPAGAVHG